MPRWGSFDAFLEDTEYAVNDEERQQMVNELLVEHPHWPWIEGNRATFIFSRFGTQSAALNLDTIKADPPFDPMSNISGTTLWYVRRDFSDDDLLDYMLAIDDPMTPLATETDIVGRVSRHWRVDPLNPVQISTAQMNVSVLRMNNARPFPDWSLMNGVPRGKVYEHTFGSAQMGFTSRKLWVYTPPDYEGSGLVYPLLVMMDGQWAVGPLQLPYIVDALIKHKRMQPVVIVMKQSAGQQSRIRDYASNDRHYSAILTELLPFVQTHYRIDSTNLGLGGVGVGAVAAAHAALMNPAVFSHLMMLSPPLGKGVAQEKLSLYAERFETADLLPSRIFQSVGRYETRSRFYKPGKELRDILQARQNEHGGIDYKFVEIGSGHGLVAFRGILPEALAHVFPGEV